MSAINGYHSRKVVRVSVRVFGKLIRKDYLPFLLLFMMGTGDAGESLTPQVDSDVGTTQAALPVMSKGASMWMMVGERHFAITLSDDPAARAFAEQLPLTLDMADLNRNEKHALLPRGLPTNAIRSEGIKSGDVMLYGAETLVIFYATFNSAYSYTPLAISTIPPA